MTDRIKSLFRTDNKTDSLESRIQGSSASRIFGEFVSTSALFPILDVIRKVSIDGLASYLGEPAHYALFAAAFIQAWFLGTVKLKSWKVRFLGNLLGFTIYFIVDLILEGAGIVSQPYHWLYGGFSLLMAVLSAWQTASAEKAVWETIITLLLNVAKVMLFPAMYMIIELDMELSAQLGWDTLVDYMSNSGHVFIVFGMLFFGILLGLGESQRLRYTGFLRYLSGRLKKYSEWSLGSDLISNSIDNPDTLKLQRVERTVLFMDIRGFTAWTEKSDPSSAVNMLNNFYSSSEEIIINNGGYKPHFTADEVMTRFVSVESAVSAAIELQSVLSDELAPFNLAVGIGIHTGEVIEGLMGSDNTRKFDIIGDTVNTAKRLESSAGKGEIVFSPAVSENLAIRPDNTTTRTLRVKGKSLPLQAFVISGNRE